MALTSKSKKFLKLLNSTVPKAQQGLQFPYIETATPNDYAMDNTQLFKSPEIRTVEANSNTNVNTDNGAGDVISNLPGVIGGIGKGLLGTYEFIKSQREKKNAKFNEKLYQKDLKERQEQYRDSFYMTPYTVGRSDDLTMQNGGVVLYQDGGSWDEFFNMYNSQQTNKKNKMNYLSDYYTQKSSLEKQKAKDLQNSGLSNMFSGILDTASSITSMLESGGEVNNTPSPSNRRTELYKSLFRKLQQGGIIDDILDTKTDDSDSLRRYNNDVRNLEQKRVSQSHSPEVNRTVARLASGKTGEGSSKIKSKERYREHQEGGEITDLYSSDFNFDANTIENSDVDLMLEMQGLEDQSVRQDDYLAQMTYLMTPESTSDENALESLTSFETTYGQQNQNTQSQSISLGQPLQVSGDISSMNSKSIAISHNNTGNIKYGNFAKKYGAIPGRRASDGGVFAKFPDIETGMQAQRDLLTSGSYADLTVDQAMKRWSNNGYGANIYPEIADKKMKDLTDQELNMLQILQLKQEDGRTFDLLFNKK